MDICGENIFPQSRANFPVKSVAGGTIQWSSPAAVGGSFSREPFVDGIIALRRQNGGKKKKEKKRHTQGTGKQKVRSGPLLWLGPHRTRTDVILCAAFARQFWPWEIGFI